MTQKTILKILAFILIMGLLAGSCSKKDYSYLNTDRRPYVVQVSERFTNPPAVLNGKWQPYKVVLNRLSPDIDTFAYSGLKPDTLFSSCSIDKLDSLFRIEISFYKIVKP